jgi:predicted ATPase
MHVYQVCAPGLHARFPPLRSLDAFSGSLPLPVSSLIGREREIARTIDALESARVVTLTGVGGVGKTRLALQVAAQVVPRFREGAWLVELAPVRDADGVVDVVAGVFGVMARAGATVEDVLVEVFQSKHLLLVLDNCEHVLEPVAEFVERLQRSCPGVVVLATSREPLAIDGELVLGVRSLDAPHGDADLAEIANADAVRLFVERAQARDSEFALREENAAAVGAVCRRLDGIPLAIELAAGRVTAMTPAELVEALGHRLDLLSGGRRRAVKRHETLRAAIDWSYELLEEDERRLLARLSVFAAGFSREAAEEVCGGDPLEGGMASELLASLVARSLLVAERDRTETRFRLLETIREYGDERLREFGELTTLRDRHRDYYAVFADRFFKEAWGPEQIRWGNLMSAERDDILAAWWWAIDSGDFDAALRISHFSYLGFQLRFSPAAMLDIHGAPQHPGYAVAVAWAACFAAVQGHFAGAEELLARAAHARDDPRVDEQLCAVEGFLAIARNELEAASGCFERCADAARAAGEPAGQVALHLATSANLCVGADPARARRVAEESLTLARLSGMPTAIAMALTSEGLAVAPDDPARARKNLEESLALSAELGYGQQDDLQTQALLAWQLRDRRLTLELAARAIRRCQWTGDRLPLIVVLNVTSRALARTRPDAAAAMRETVAAIRSDDPLELDDTCTSALAEIDAALMAPNLDT